MMRLPPFRYVAPRSAKEAARWLLEHGPEALPVAGGTDLLPSMKRRLFEPKLLVGLRGIEGLRGVQGGTDEALELGALTTLAEISGHPLVRGLYPALARAAGLVSSPPLRNVATLGGNVCIDTRCNYYNQSFEWREAIDFCMKKDGGTCWVAPGSKRCWAVHSSDTAPVLMALGAEISLEGPQGERRVALRELYRPDGVDFINKRHEEILTRIHLPPPGGLRATYLKLRRRGSIDFPIVGVAVAMKTAPDGTVEDVRVVLTAVESAPVEAHGARGLLRGKRLDPELIEQAAEKAYRPARPLDNTDLTHAYRKKMVRVFVARALTELAELT